MEDHLPGQDAAESDGLPKRCLDEVGVHVVGHASPEDPAGVSIADDAEVRPPFSGAQVGDVAEPGDVAFPLVELPLHKVGDRERIVAVDSGRRVPGARADTRDSIFPHDRYFAASIPSRRVKQKRSPLVWG